jgi:hypothetical protein
MIAEKKELYTAKKKSGIDCNDPDIQLSWDELRSNTSAINWLLLGIYIPNYI